MLASTLMNLNDIENLVVLFLQKKMRADLWTHEAHFVVATHLLWEHGFSVAMPMLRELIKANNVNMGNVNTDTSGYHETLTWFYLEAIDQILKAQLPKDAHVAITCVLHSEIIDKNYPFKFYDKDDLFSVVARREYLKPAMQGWFPKSLRTKTFSLLSATLELHQQFKSTLNDTTTMRHLIGYFGTSVWTDEMVQERFEKFATFENEGAAKFYFIETQDAKKIVGQCGFKNIDKKKQAAELGIILHQDVWGTGIAKEAVGLCLHQAFDHVGLQHVFFITDPQNKKAQSAMEKGGARQAKNADPSVLEYEILKSDWDKIKISSNK